MSSKTNTKIEVAKPQTVKSKISSKKNLTMLSMLLPGLIVMALNNYLPMFGLVFAFRKMDTVQKLFGSGWNGLKNFEYLFSSNAAWKITRNTIGYNVVFIIIGLILPVFMAICLNELRNKRAAKFYQSLFFIPYFLSWVVISYVVFGLLSNEYGAVNRIIQDLGGDKVSWYSKPEMWPYILVLVNTWKWTGYDTIVYLSAVCGVNQELFEAASVDGASRLQQIWYITIPSLIPLAIVLVLLRLGRMFYTDMGLFYSVPRNTGVLQDVTNTIDTYVYRAFTATGNIGLSAAAGFYQAVLGLVVILGFNAIVRKYDPDSAII